MRAFLYDKYGYYPEDEFATSFEKDGWIFKLEISEKNDSEIHSLRILLEEIHKKIPSIGSDIIMARDGHYVSMSEYGPVVLVAVKNASVNLNTLYQLHMSFLGKFNNEDLRISHLRNLWIDKTNIIEEKIVSSIPLTNEINKRVYLITQYALGLAENAIQYLLDTATNYGDRITNTTISHKRLERLDSFYLMNPFNLIIDSPMRDLAELYKNNQISINDLSKLLNNYKISIVDASLLLARCLYPSHIFDVVEDYYELHKSFEHRGEELYLNLESNLLRIKKLYRLLVSKYSIRPISWLE